MKLTCTISGSFQKFLGEISVAAQSLRDLDIEVLSPISTEMASVEDGFVILHGDKGAPREIQQKHFDAINFSSFLLVVNPGGYIGCSTTLEIGYALSKTIPVFCTDQPEEKTIREFVCVASEVVDIASALRSNENLFPTKTDLPSLQNYVKRMVLSRGFDDESAQDVMLLLVEEVGELAKALRKQIGLKIDSNSEQKQLGAELCDCLVYLIDLANLCNIDLQTALIENELRNGQRCWQNQAYPPSVSYEG